MEEKNKYEPVRTENFYLRSESEIRVTEESQLERIEKKMDRILELLEGKELSVSFDLDGKKVAEILGNSVKNGINRSASRQQRLERGLS